MSLRAVSRLDDDLEAVRQSFSVLHVSAPRRAMLLLQHGLISRDLSEQLASVASLDMPVVAQSPTVTGLANTNMVNNPHHGRPPS
jgi:hypothetical protein